MLNFEQIIHEELYDSSVDEISTSGGAGAFLTKNAFSKGKKPKYKLVDGYTEVKEGIVKKPKGAGSLPPYKATKVNLGHLKTSDDGVEKPSQYLDIGYKKVNRKKLAKNSKGVDYVDINNTSYK